MKNNLFITATFFTVLSVGGMPALAQSIPGSADSARIKNEPPKDILSGPATSGVTVPQRTLQEAPKGASDIQFVLKGVDVSGNTALSNTQLKPSYEADIGKTIGLDRAWAIAASITDQYRRAGYFLSRAYVPAQAIPDGVIKIQVVEGFVESVSVSGETIPSLILNPWIERIKSFRPLRTQDMESALIELNGGYGSKYRAVFRPPTNTNGEDGGTELQLIIEKSEGTGYIAFDNYGSRFLGPHELTAVYIGSIISGQSTAISLQGSIPLDELKGVFVRHKVPLLPKVSADITASYTGTQPGYTLEPQDIHGKTYAVAAGLNYQWILQRQMELSSRLEFGATNSTTDILSSTTLAEDRIRVLRGTLQYGAYDGWNGRNDVSLMYSQGMSVPGSSKKDDLNLSRAEAPPDFSKLSMSAMRRQSLPGDFSLTVNLQGQVASDPLYSSEEFGFGGATMGRAYDNSEIVGDNGIAGSVEIGYYGLEPVYNFSVAPYVFHDIGKVWNLDDAGQDKEQSASSAGFGVRLLGEQGIRAEMGIAWPLTKPANDPLYTSNHSAPRVGFQLGYSF